MACSGSPMTTGSTSPKRNRIRRGDPAATGIRDVNSRSCGALQLEQATAQSYPKTLTKLIAGGRALAEGLARLAFSAGRGALSQIFSRGEHAVGLCTVVRL